MELSLELLLILFLVAAFAGLVDTLAGGGGLITVPVLLLTGMPPVMALGTNKLQGVAGTATASIYLLRSRALDWRKIKPLLPFALGGAALGTLLVQLVEPRALTLIIPTVLVLIAAYFLALAFRPGIEGRERISDTSFRRWVVPGIGFYDGMFGPGTGSFFSLAGSFFRGQSVVEASVNTKALNCATNLASLVVFILAGQVLWLVGGVMALGQLIGAWLGARSLLRVKPLYLKLLIVVVCLLMLARYLVQQVSG